ncbi:hypothetical protein BDQ17DRAFT_171359 [Cyathus striatus]|nr:hypothetical protein BDQ17DRAFT_171359 [Cyathus striatus]
MVYISFLHVGINPHEIIRTCGSEILIDSSCYPIILMKSVSVLSPKFHPLACFICRYITSYLSDRTVHHNMSIDLANLLSQSRLAIQIHVLSKPEDLVFSPDPDLVPYTPPQRTFSKFTSKKASKLSCMLGT